MLNPITLFRISDDDGRSFQRLAGGKFEELDTSLDLEETNSSLQHPATTADRQRWNVGQVTIDMLLNEILLEIFDYYLNQTRS